MSNEKLYRSIDLSPEVDVRKVSGYAVVFDSMSENLGFYETIKRGAITEELIANSDVFARFDHDESKILARSNHGNGSLKLSLDSRGLYYSFEAPNTALGDELLEHIRRGDLNKSSFCFSINMDDKESQNWEKRDGKIYRTINKIERLYDISPVWQAAYSDTSCANRSLSEYETNQLSILNTEEENNETRNMKEEDKEKQEEKPVDEETKQEEKSCDNSEDDENTSEDKEEKSCDKEEEDSEETEEKSCDGEDCEEEDKDEQSTDEEKEEKTKRSNITMKKEFSLIKAIRSIANNQPLDKMTEKICGEARSSFTKAGLNYGGQIQLPTEELRAKITVESEGEDVVATDIFSILEPLRAKNVLVQAGAKFLTGLVGDVQVPIMSASNVTWEGETASAKDGAGAFTHVKLSPKRLTAFIDISKQFLAQDGLGAEALIRQDLINAINSKLEATILGNVAGTSTQPAGIFNGETLENVSSFADITAMEAGVEEANVFGEMKYIVAPSAKGKLRAMPRAEGKLLNPVMENGTIDGTPVLSTSNVGKNMLVYGDFSNLAIGSWGAIDLTIDPYTKAGDGQIRLVINAYFDAKVLRPEAFAFGSTGPTAAPPTGGEESGENP